jgi:hypothetical protein
METGWYIRTVSGEVEGPLTATELKQGAQEGWLLPELLVRKGTEGSWVPANHVKGLFAASPAGARTTSKVAIPLDEPPFAPPEFNASQLGFDASVSSSRRFLHKKSPKSLFGFIDLGFQHYLTPIIIKVIWGLCLVLAALGAAGTGISLIAGLLPESEKSMSVRSSSDDMGWSLNRPSARPGVFQEKLTILALKIVAWLVLVVVIAIGLLIIRVICESIIVLFNIAESLVSIDRKTATG